MAHWVRSGAGRESHQEQERDELRRLGRLSERVGKVRSGPGIAPELRKNLAEISTESGAPIGPD